MVTQFADQVVTASANFTDIGTIGWIIIGSLAGWIASKIMGTDREMGIFLNIIVGVVGGWLGGYLLRHFLHTSTFDFGKVATFFTALAGACILLLLVKLVTRRR